MRHVGREGFLNAVTWLTGVLLSVNIEKGRLAFKMTVRTTPTQTEKNIDTRWDYIFLRIRDVYALPCPNWPEPSQLNR